MMLGEWVRWRRTKIRLFRSALRLRKCYGDAEAVRVAEGRAAKARTASLNSRVLFYEAVGDEIERQIWRLRRVELLCRLTIQRQSVPKEQSADGFEGSGRC